MRPRGNVVLRLPGRLAVHAPARQMLLWLMLYAYLLFVAHLGRCVRGADVIAADDKMTSLHDQVTVGRAGKTSSALGYNC